MPRIARGLSDGGIYHVLNRGNGRQRVFQKDDDFAAFITLLRQARERHPVKILAYCLIPNHFHLLLNAEEGVALSRFMQWLMTSHVRRYHGHYQTSGHVWQGRFKSFIIQKDAHLLTVARYIEGNPLRAGLVSSAGEWRWSSHRESCGDEERSMTCPLPVMIPDDWTAFVDTPLTSQELDRLQESVDRQAPFGSGKWQTRICSTLGLESTMRPRGRPKKRMEK
jgi:putative transposase